MRMTNTRREPIFSRLIKLALANGVALAKTNVKKTKLPILRNPGAGYDGLHISLSWLEH